jgi:8-oxo-dGTP diphosphatase
VKEIHVAVCVVWRGDRVLIARRPDHAHQGGLLEFPGGKVEAGESVQQALSRELAEETGLQVGEDQWQPVIGIRHDYGDKRVFLDVWETREAKGEPESREGQPLQWMGPGSMEDPHFPAANRPIIRAVRLPRALCITAPDVTVPQLATAIATERPGMVVLRAPGLDGADYLTMAKEAVALCEAHGTALLLHGNAGLAASLPGVAGVHLPWLQAKELSERPLPGDLWLGVSCHDRAQIEQAEAIGADYVTLGPVTETPTHPGAGLLGWEAFAALASRARLPVFALGGMNRSRLSRAMAAGAQGIAGIRFWMNDNQRPQEVQ